VAPIIFRSKDWESAHRRHLAWVTEAYGIDLVVDAGANVGQFASMLREIGYEKTIVSFEPVRHYATQLARAAAGDARWDTYPFALGRQDATVAMNVSQGTGSSVLTPNGYGMDCFSDLQEWTVQEVLVRRLDSVLEAEGCYGDARIFLKMDTQGYDLEVFGGVSRLIDQVVAIQSEVSLLPIYDGMPSMAESLAVYASAGFHISGMFPVSTEGRTGRVLEFDCLLVPAQVPIDPAGQPAA